MDRVYLLIDQTYDFTVGSALRSFFRIAATFRDTKGTTDTSTPLKEAETDSSETSFKTVGNLLSVRGETSSEESLSKRIAYIGSTRVPLFKSPTKEFDTVVSSLAYGSMVMVLEEKGRFSRVAANGVEGWVLREDLLDRAAYVYPEFSVGGENGPDDPNTLRLRASIRDEFNGIEAEIPLQAGEYVLYKLFRKGKAIDWPETRPRTPGRWHVILRGKENIKIGIAPKNGSIMECILENDVGHVAYVEAVFPDGSITISEANYPDHGMYSERTLTKGEWQAVHAVFIEVL